MLVLDCHLAGVMTPPPELDPVASTSKGSAEAQAPRSTDKPGPVSADKASQVAALLAEVNELDAGSNMSLSQKLVKGLVLVLSGLQHTIGESVATTASTQADSGPADPFLPASFRPSSRLAQSRTADLPAPQLTAAQYSELLEILASALKDASSAPWLWSADAAPPSIGAQAVGMTPVATNVHDVLGGCDPLLGVSSDQMQRVEAEAAPAIVVRDVPALLFENLNDLVSLLRPASFEAAEDGSLAANGAVTAPTSPQTSSPAPDAKLAAINRLAPELLTRVLTLARNAKDETACECEHACVSSRAAAQRWALSLMLVCREWRTPAARAAYSQVRIRRRGQISALVKLIHDKPEMGEYIGEADIKVPAVSGPTAGSSLGGPSAFLGHPRSAGRRGVAFPWLNPPEKRSKDTNEKSEEDNQLISTLVQKCPGIAKLKLNISKPGYGSWAYGADFLEQGLERALSLASCLRSLVLRTCIDYCELEAILMACGTLEVLKLEAGIDNLDGTDDALTEPHKSRLREFSLSSFESSDVGEQQLCWLLRPSVGTLARLEVATAVALTAAGLAGGNPFPPFSGYHFAQLLVELAPTLTRLALKDSLAQAGMALNQVNPTMRAPPHDGTFDFVLERCVKLRELALEWTFCGPAFLSSLAGKPVEALALLGQPNQHIAAKDLANRITAVEDDGGFSKLERLALAHFPLHNPQAGWAARDVRYLRRACTERNLSFEFTTI